MTGIAKYVSNPQIKAILRETDGIGTPATQASIIQRLFDRHFIEEQKRQIISTPTARSLIAALPDVATQPDMTALWEASLRKISEGQAPLDTFLEAVRRQLGELVARAKSAGAAALRLPAVETRPCRAPGCAGALRKRISKSGPFWACSRYPDCKFTENAGSSAQPKARGRRPRQRVQAR
jgi:DNA topoisomerase-3